MTAVEAHGCEHYRRNCRLVSPCCDRVYTCRLCHDEVEQHVLDRHAVQRVECAACSAQQTVSAACHSCGLVFGTAYFCPTCRLYDNEDKGQFHCRACGICRVGGRANFEHCATCRLCMAAGREHVCRVDSGRNPCPLCYEDIFSSRMAAHIPPCGHALHHPCYAEMSRKGLFACPLCGKSMNDMTTVWQHLDDEIAASPMPGPYRDLHRPILCKDCLVKGTAPYHVAGMKCGACGGYNTSLEGPLQKQIRTTDAQGAVRLEYVNLSDSELQALSSQSSR